MTKGFMMAMLAMYGAMSMYDVNNKSHYSEEPTREEWEEYNRRIQQKKSEMLKRQGLKEFHYPNCTIIALNQKNADRKYQNLIKQSTP